MIKISKLADYAIVILVHMDQERDKLHSASHLSGLSHVPEPTVSKVLKLLSKASLIEAVRGANGGYKLKQPLQGISVKTVLEAIEGPINLTECVDDGHACAIEKYCPSYGRWDDVNTAIVSALDNISAASLIEKE